MLRHAQEYVGICTGTISEGAYEEDADVETIDIRESDDSGENYNNWSLVGCFADADVWMDFSVPGGVFFSKRVLHVKSQNHSVVGNVLLQLTPVQTSDVKGGRSFRGARGRGYVAIKLTQAACPVATHLLSSKSCEAANLVKLPIL